MKIYTKKGDNGETGLFGNARVPKDDLRIKAYGTFDELNSILGLSLCEAEMPQTLRPGLERIQGELFQMGTEVATPRGKDSGIKLLDHRSTEALEVEIDKMESELPPLKTFILPGGTRISSLLHIARTVCRRAEREFITLNRVEPQRAEALQYLNRLSDYFFVSSRFSNFKLGKSDIPWSAPLKK